MIRFNNQHDSKTFRLAKNETWFVFRSKVIALELVMAWPGRPLACFDQAQTNTYRLHGDLIKIQSQHIQ